MKAMRVHSDTDGAVWMVNLIDVTELPAFVRSTVASWLDTDLNPQTGSNRVDDIWYPLVGDDAEQVDARRDLLKKGRLTGGRTVRMRSRGGLP